MGVVTGAFPRRGEVWIVDLEPVVGHEIQKSRPCLVVSPDGMNRFLKTLTIVPMTSGSRPAPFRVPCEYRGKAGFLLPEQMRTVDRRRLRACWGTIDQPTIAILLATLREMFEE